MHRRQIIHSKPDIDFRATKYNDHQAVLEGYLADYQVPDDSDPSGRPLDLLATMSDDVLIEELTGAYCESIEVIPRKERPTGRFMGNELVSFERKVIKDLNADRDKVDRIAMPRGLANYQVVDLLILSKHFANIVFSEDSSDEAGTHLAVYVEKGRDKGIWSISERDISHAIWEVCPEVSAKGVSEVMDRLRSDEDVPTLSREEDPDLIPMQNGIFDYKTKALHPFSPDHVFLSKSHTRWNPDAKDVSIVMPDGRIFTVDKWMAALSDDPEIVQLLWEGISAVLRPHVSWNKVMMLFSESGNNGKGTYCKMLRNLLGKGTAASMPLSNFDKDFMLEPLLTAQAIVTDENSIGTFLQDAANFKAVVTHDPICVNRKHKQAVTVQFDGFMLQCFNELPRTRDKTDSIYRRLLFVPMDKCFTGREIKEIKNDYLNRPEVLEYIAYRALMSDFYEFSNPEASQDALEEFKNYNDPVREFFNEVICDKGVLDAYSWDILYEMYRGYMRESNPNGKPQSYRTFMDDMAALVNRSNAWCMPQGDRHSQFRVGTRMAGCEPLINYYDIRKCMREGAKPGSPEAATDVYPNHNSRIRGIYRRVNGNGKPVGKAGHLSQGGGTDGQPVTKMSASDVRTMPDGTRRMASGAPVPDDIAVELGIEVAPDVIEAGTVADVEAPDAKPGPDEGAGDVAATSGHGPSAVGGVTDAVENAAGDAEDAAGDAEGAAGDAEGAADGTPEASADAMGATADAPVRPMNPMSMAVPPSSFPEKMLGPGLHRVEPDEDEEPPVLRLFDDDDDEQAAPGLHLVGGSSEKMDDGKEGAGGKHTDDE